MTYVIYDHNKDGVSAFLTIDLCLEAAHISFTAENIPTERTGMGGQKGRM